MNGIMNIKNALFRPGASVLLLPAIPIGTEKYKDQASIKMPKLYNDKEKIRFDIVLPNINRKKSTGKDDEGI